MEVLIGEHKAGPRESLYTNYKRKAESINTNSNFSFKGSYYKRPIQKAIPKVL
jgi:hypothetical protein